MKEIVIKGYEFNELSPKAQNKILNDFSHILVENNDWHDPIIEEFCEDMMANCGIENAQVQYTGFWSQGDGACFTAKNIDLLKLFNHMKETKYFDIPKAWLKAAKNKLITASIVKIDSHYHHSNTVRADVEYNDLDANAIYVVITAWVRDEADKLYQVLQNQYEIETSNATIIQEIEEREYLFTKAGELIKQS